MRVKVKSHRARQFVPLDIPEHGCSKWSYREASQGVVTENGPLFRPYACLSAPSSQWRFSMRAFGGTESQK